MNVASLFRFSNAAVRPPRRHGLTLIELMIAVTLTLIIVAAMIRAFTVSSKEISRGRANMDMHTKMRSVAATLRSDLQMMTVSPRPRGVSDENSGYLECVEGVRKDDTGAASPVPFGYLGDVDDVMAMTIRSKDRPFRGRFNGTFVESYVAEVIWWTVHEDTDNPPAVPPVVDYHENINLYRRVLLVRPDLTSLIATNNINAFYADNDVSVRPAGGVLIANTLEDLTKRENRFAHDAGLFPHEYIPGMLASRVLTGDAEGEDFMLGSVIGFDVKVFSPDAFAVSTNGQAVEYSDPGFGNVNLPVEESVGGYVDLGYSKTTSSYPGGVVSQFSSWPFQNTYVFNSATYCTWSTHYESDGIDQDGDGLVDEGTDGIDNDGINGVDDNGERETQPPYPYPIRSIQVSLRIVDKTTNQVLQKTVKESFVPN